jgi:hypothetical protein
MASFKQDGCQGTRGLRCPGGRCLVAHAPLGQPGRGAPEVAAVTIGRTDTALDAFRRRLSARIGKVKAITATARKIAVLSTTPCITGWATSTRGRPATKPVIACAGHRQLASARQGLRLCAPTNCAGGRFLGKPARATPRRRGARVGAGFGSRAFLIRRDWSLSMRPRSLPI